VLVERITWFIISLRIGHENMPLPSALGKLAGYNVSLPFILSILLILEREGPIGRYTVSRWLKISEGVTRGLLRRLCERNLATSLRAGTLLTDRGKHILHEALRLLGVVAIKALPLSGLSKGSANLVAQIRGFEGSLGICLEERDVAVRYGAKGAVIMRYTSGTITVPGVYADLRVRHPDEDYILRREFDLIDGDLLVVVFNHNEWALAPSLFAIALKLKGYLTI